jgi:hypothetical protein
MEILQKYWLPILGIMLPMLISAVVFFALKRWEKGSARVKNVICAVLTVLTVLSGAALGWFVLSVGGGIELILPLLLLPLLMMLL